MPECTHAHPLGKPRTPTRGESRNEGVSPMIVAPSRKATGLAAAGLLLAGLFGLIQLAPAQTKDKGKKDDKDKEGKTAKAPAKLAPLKMVIVSKDADVAEMKKVIDEKIAKGWEENKVAPTGYCD